MLSPTTPLDKLKEQLAGKETLLEELYCTRAKISELELRRTRNYDALAAINKGKADDKIWFLGQGDFFMKLDEGATKRTIERDQEEVARKLKDQRGKSQVLMATLEQFEALSS